VRTVFRERVHFISRRALPPSHPASAASLAFSVGLLRQGPVVERSLRDEAAVSRVYPLRSFSVSGRVFQARDVNRSGAAGWQHVKIGRGTSGTPGTTRLEKTVRRTTPLRCLPKRPVRQAWRTGSHRRRCDRFRQPAGENGAERRPCPAPLESAPHGTLDPRDHTTALQQTEYPGERVWATAPN
jgi:hypothetical protein